MLLIYIIIGSLLASFIMLRVILIRKGGYSFPWLQFYIRGKEERFRLYEINNLQRLVVNTKLRDPLSIYWSKKAVVACLTSIDKQYKDDGTLEHPHEAQNPEVVNFKSRNPKNARS